MKRIYIIITALFFFAKLFSQSLYVGSFKILDSDLTANTAGTMELDQNGETAALIKVVTNQTGFTFDGGSLGIVATKQTPGEVWVYIPRGSKKISIKHPQLGVLRDYYFPCSIDAARTYEMKLITGTIETSVRQARTSQYVVFQLTPSNAIVELNGEQLKTTDGLATKIMKFGTYNYRVNAPDYLPEAGNVTINDPENKHIVNISLKPNFSQVTLTVGNDAEIWVNGEMKGIGSWTGNLGAGTYEFETRKQNYRRVTNTYDIVVTSEPQYIQLQAPLPIYGELDVNSNPAMAELYIDGVKKGLTPQLISNLLIGQHIIDIKKEGYGVYSSSIYLEENQPYTINAILNNITSVIINCNNPSADLFIDGTSFGKASGEKEIEIGKHLIEIKPDIFSNQIVLKQEVDIKGDNKYLFFNLEPRELKVEFKVDKPYTYLYIDGKMITNNLNNSSYYTYVSTPGVHEIKLRCKGEKELVEEFEFNSKQCKFHASFKDRSINVIQSHYSNSNVVIDAPQGCFIYVNGTKMGKAPWIGKLIEGTYKVEARKDSHTSISKTITIGNDEIYNITLPSPIPISGGIIVESNPIGAKIVIDEKNLGVTPMSFDTLSVGKHIIRVTKKGYSSFLKELNIVEKKKEKINIILEKQQENVKCIFQIDDSDRDLGNVSEDILRSYKERKLAHIIVDLAGFDDDISFDIECNNNGVIYRTKKEDMICLYVNEGVQEIKIKNDSGSICDYKFPIPIKGGHNYFFRVLLIQKGIMELDNGLVYDGYIVSQTPHGYGIIRYPNGDRFEGEFEYGVRINGKYTFANGHSDIWFADEPKVLDFETTSQNNNCTITKIEKNTDYTKIYMVFTTSGNWCSISPDTYITTNSSQNRYKLVHADGIAITPERTISKGKVNFVLTFPPLPDTVHSLDLIEPGESSWKFYNIKI